MLWHQCVLVRCFFTLRIGRRGNVGEDEYPRGGETHKEPHESEDGEETENEDEKD
jgi:hypothetical protein